MLSLTSTRAIFWLTGVSLAQTMTAWAQPIETATSPSSPAAIENSIGMKFVRIPAGSFYMGNDKTPAQLANDFPGYDPARFLKLTDETPRLLRRIRRDFLLGQHEVTRAQFRRFVEQSGYIPESISDGTGGYGHNPLHDPDAPTQTVRGDAFEGRRPHYSWQNPGFHQTEDDPVVNVTWNDAQALAHWLSIKENRRYRLPTEAEWEYACRAGTDTHYFNGDDPEQLVNIANTFDAAAAPHWPRWHNQALKGHDGHAFTAPTGSYHPNAFGVYDMIGNVWEWVEDRHTDDYYANAPTDDPPGPTEGDVRVRRGGSWHTWSLYARCAFRNWNTAQTRYPLLGIRLLLEIPAP